MMYNTGVVVTRTPHAAPSGGSSKLAFTKLPPCGAADNGYQFDSGCNLSGVKKVYVECGKYYWEYGSVMKRIVLEFNNSGDDNPHQAAVIYHAQDAHKAEGGNKTFTMDVKPNDPITKVVVWADHRLVTAVQFHMASGRISPVYGIPVSSSETKTFEGPHGQHSALVGLYGTYNSALCSIGFTFAATNASDEVDGTMSLNTEDLSSVITSFSTTDDDDK
ncbi:unknown protein [Seminavis robusta]|uniref:Jacalin-type lectin domain-containing protein n=1 Tax=Seminavis robusta TaxID=568900 RepID=A0A9N8H6P1_9STRA|nr:unknown protein [Seminavis robusta]|eukprot:Sro118_g057550.1 n/a (219) ;mRNA; f:1538-2194